MNDVCKEGSKGGVLGLYATECRESPVGMMLCLSLLVLLLRLITSRLHSVTPPSWAHRHTLDVF